MSKRKLNSPNQRDDGEENEDSSSSKIKRLDFSQTEGIKQRSGDDLWSKFLDDVKSESKTPYSSNFASKLMKSDSSITIETKVK